MSPAATEEEWLRLADEVQPPPGDQRLAALGREPIREGLRNLHRLFSDAPVLGSLIDPNELPADLFAADYETLQPYLAAALTAEDSTVESLERAVTASGMARAASLLALDYTLVVTNVPYLGRRKQNSFLTQFCDDHYETAKQDLATCFVERRHCFLDAGGTLAVVALQNALFLGTYREFRERLLKTVGIDFIVRLGAKGFQTPMYDFGVTFLCGSRPNVQPDSRFLAIDVSEEPSADAKSSVLPTTSADKVSQCKQLDNPDCVIVFEDRIVCEPLSAYAASYQGAGLADIVVYRNLFWELDSFRNGWVPHQSSPNGVDHFSGFQFATFWEDGAGSLASSPEARIQGKAAWGKDGIACAWLGRLPVGLYLGTLFDNSVAAIIPKDPANLVPIWCFCSSPEFHTEVRKINQKTQVANATLVKVPFDLSHWQQVAQTQYPQGLSEPETDDPTQWIFHGRPEQSTAVLQVAVARLVGYKWPAETDRNMRLSDRARELVQRCDELHQHADEDGIVCLAPVKGEASAADRLTRLLSDAYCTDWSSGKLETLLREAGFESKPLDEWLRDGFFKQHCKLFRDRPFVWHIWDGRRDGFHALVNYHRLTCESGEGRRTLEKLIYSYLGDWIEQQEREQRQEKDGADARLTSAKDLKGELEKILAGEPPYDIFVRWKPLSAQPIGWEPDMNDGVRINIRPFMSARPLAAKGKNPCILRVSPKIKWEKDRGKEPLRPKEEFPWFWSWDGETWDFTGGAEFCTTRWTDLHYSNAVKQAARDRHAQEAK